MRMRAEKLRLAAVAERAHLLPQGNGGARVVTGLGRELDADAIGLGLHRAAVWQRHGERGEQRAALHGEARTGRDTNRLHADVGRRGD